VKLDFKLSKKGIFTSAIALITFLNVHPWIVWDISYINRVLHAAVIILCLIYIPKTQSLKNIPILFLLIICSLYMAFGGLNYSSKIGLLLIALLVYLVLPDTLKMEVLRKFEIILAFILLIGIIIYISRRFYYVPSFVIKSHNPDTPWYYIFLGFEVYPTSWEVFILHRFMSVFDEPGVVGTLLALIITYKKFTFNSVQNKIFLVAGLISFSLAFYIVMLLNLAFYKPLNIKYIVLFLFLGAGFYFLFPDTADTYLLQRATIVNGHIDSKNRLSAHGEGIYQKFVIKGGPELLFGNGQGASKNDKLEGFSYKLLIYDYGIIGIILMFSFFFISTVKTAPNRNGFFFLFIYLILAYQRINIFDFFNIVIFFGGLLSLANANKNAIENSSKSSWVNITPHIAKTM
jgi:hypothetical protein